MECMYPPSLSSINEYRKMSTVYVDYIFFIQSPKNPRWVSGLIHSLALVNAVTNEDGCAGVSVVFSHISLGMHPAVGEMNHTVVLLLVFSEVSTLISTNLILLSPVLHKNFQCSFLMASCQSIIFYINFIFRSLIKIIIILVAAIQSQGFPYNQISFAYRNTSHCLI